MGVRQRITARPPPRRHSASKTRVNALLAGASSSLVPHASEGAERRKGAGNIWHLLEVPRAVSPARAPPGAPQWRFWAQSPCFFERTGGTSPHVIQAALAPPFIRSRPAIKGSPLIGCGR